ncbi:hypothetical protein ACA910_006213 [Epithemia clementina (nom. ined.)]
MMVPSSVTYAAILGLGCTCLEAFIPLRHRPLMRNNVRPIRVSGLGWDNDNFLNSLSGGDKDREEANDKYFKMSRYGRPEDGDDEEGKDDLSKSFDGAELTSDMIEKMKKSHTPDEEASGGGKMFREMMNRAKERQPQIMPPPPVQPYYAPPPPPPPAYPQQFSPPQPQPFMPLDPNNLSVEEQARMFREIMMQQQNAAAGVPAPAPQMPPVAYPTQYYAPLPQPPVNAPANYLQGGVDTMGRRIGRNRDADAIVNSADVYFAQLKRDSSLRNIARFSGDDEKANAVFSDPSLKEIKLHVNPYLEEQKAKERQLLETSPDELILPEMFMDDRRPTKSQSYAGVSYRENLTQRKQSKRTGSSQGSTAAPGQQQQQIQSTTRSAPSPPERLPSTSSAAAPAAAPVVKENKKMTYLDSASTPTKQEAMEVEYEPVVQPVQERSRSSSSSSSSTDSSTTVASEESTRKDIRTLMGLLLKHRGGPGFGPGRLQGGEAQKLQDLIGQLSELLREEAKQFPQQDYRGAQDLTMNVPTSPPASAPRTTATRPPPATTAPVSSSSSSAIDLATVRPQVPITTLLACIEGAIQMYRNSPPELQEGVLVNLRAALLSALSACDSVISNNERKNLEAFRAATSDPRTRDNRPNRETTSGASSSSSYFSVPSYDQSLAEEVRPSTTPRPERINSLLSCVEGAILMYKNSPPELEEGVLITLRAALLSAARTCNSIITDGGGDSYMLYQSGKQTNNHPKTTTPTQFYDVVPEEETTVVSAAAPPKDENSEFLEQVLEKLAAAAGNGKMGLREDLSAAEATELSNSIAKMRSILVEELENGTSSSPPVPSPSSVSAKYEEMLAKARADKKTKL